MHVKRSKHARDFTIVPNKVARNRKLSLAAKGLHLVLLTQPEWTDETIKSLTADEEEGTTRVNACVRQLQEAGYVVVTNRQDEKGRWSKLVTVYDVPVTDAAPKTDEPKVGKPKPRSVGRVPSGEKNREKNPPLPPKDGFEETAPAVTEEGRGEAPENTNTLNEETGRAAGVLSRIGRDMPALRLTPSELLTLAPIAAEWLSRGATELQLRGELTEGLPGSIKSPAKLLANRLERKMPPAPVQVEPLGECGKCEAVLPRGWRPDICGRCAGAAPASSQIEASSGLSEEGADLLVAIRTRRASGRLAPGAKSAFMAA